MTEDTTEPRPTPAPKPPRDSAADLPPNLPELDPSTPEEDEEGRLPEIVDAGEEGAEGPRAVGRAAIERAVRLAPTAPGVYRMLNAGREGRYVGKAKNV